MKRTKLLAALAALMLILAACTSDDEGAADTTESFDLVQGGGERLAAVIDADVIVCGVNDGLPALGVVEAEGNY